MTLMKSWLLTRVVHDCPVLRDAKIRHWGSYRKPLLRESG